MNQMENHEVTYALNVLSIVPLRAEPNHQSEMVTQILFGEYMKVIKTQEGWSYVKLEQDSYKGWAETTQLEEVSKTDYELSVSCQKVKVLENVNSVLINNKKTLLFKGCNLPFYSNGIFVIKDKEIQFKGEVISGKQNRTSIINTAHTFLNTPYLWGGKTPFGLDCSGFTQLVYHINGYAIQRDASLQALQGELVAFLTQAEASDLAFFDDDEGNITHVGIILNDDRIIHAAQGKVRIDKLDQEGIYNNDIKKYTHHLRMVRKHY